MSQIQNYKPHSENEHNQVIALQFEIAKMIKEHDQEKKQFEVLLKQKDDRIKQQEKDHSVEMENKIKQFEVLLKQKDDRIKQQDDQIKDLKRRDA